MPLGLLLAAANIFVHAYSVFFRFATNIMLALQIFDTCCTEWHRQKSTWTTTYHCCPFRHTGLKLLWDCFPSSALQTAMMGTLSLMTRKPSSIIRTSGQKLPLVICGIMTFGEANSVAIPATNLIDRLLYSLSDKEGTHFSTAWILLSVLLGALAMLCKEQGITILGLNALFDAVVINKLNILEVVLKILHKDKSLEVILLNFRFQEMLLKNLSSDKSLVVFRKGLLFRITLLVSGGATMLYVRWQIMGTGPPAFTDVDNPASFADSLFVRAINYNYYYSLNAWLLLCPWWLCFDWSMGCVPLIKSVSDWRIIALAILWFCLIALMCQALCSEDSQKRRILTLGLGFLIIPFLPASNLFFRVGFVVAERVTYLPSIGYCMLITYGFSLLSKQAKKKKLLVAALLGLLLINVWRCIIRSNQWRSEEQLFRSALSVCPLNAKVHYNVGKNLADKGNQTAAINYYREAVRLNPKYVHAMNNLGNILKERNELHEAEELLSLAVQIQYVFKNKQKSKHLPTNKEPNQRAQSFYADLNRHIDALNAWRNATVLKPQHSLAWNNMIILLDNTGTVQDLYFVLK
ncbi:hypothetical protein lerEdw1_017065 [Lerista edwardsae]|nr:hypothetical protein lerEdw1_017065 [Lerista edwardsae]